MILDSTNARLIFKAVNEPERVRVSNLSQGVVRIGFNREQVLSSIDPEVKQLLPQGSGSDVVEYDDFTQELWGRGLEDNLLVLVEHWIKTIHKPVPVWTKGEPLAGSKGEIKPTVRIRGSEGRAI